MMDSVDRFTDEDGTHEPTLRVQSLHALEYCPRLFYLEEVEGLSVANARVFAGRRLHESLAQQDAEFALGAIDRGLLVSSLLR